MLGVHQPDFGFLLDAMQMPDGSTLSLSARADPAACGGRSPSCCATRCRAGRHRGAGARRHRVRQSVLRDRRFSHSRLEDRDRGHRRGQCVVRIFVLGADRVPPRSLDLAVARMEIRKNGALAATGSARSCRAIQRSPSRGSRIPSARSAFVRGR
jgi:2-oxopent-4-enoate/cis-2-oxohex-4-enoate hydratase